MKNNKGVAPILIVLIIISVLVVAGGIYYFFVKRTQKSAGCIQEAKICPDGSAVGRTGPNCEFTECPIVDTGETADWQTYRNDEYEFKYPSDWHMFGSSCLNPEEVGPDYCTVVIELSRKNIQEVLNEKKTEYSGFIFEESTIFVDGAERFLLTNKDPHQFTIYTKITILENNGLIYIFGGDGEKWTIINKILSTFKFLE